MPTHWYGLVCSEDNVTVLNITLWEFNLEGSVQQNAFDGLNTSTKIDLFTDIIVAFKRQSSPPRSWVEQNVW